MSELRFQSKIEQLAGFFRNELIKERWVDLMPGREELAKEFGINSRTVEEALRQLEREGILLPQGAGRRRKIQTSKDGAGKVLRIGFLVYSDEDRSSPYNIDLVHRLGEEGHRVVMAEKSLVDMRMDVSRVAKLADAMEVDAYMVQAGSAEVLGRLAGSGRPVIAQFGRFAGLDVAAAGVRKIPAMQKAVQRLHAWGHRRIVMIAREERRKPSPAHLEQSFLEELERLGIRTGPFNLPDWGNEMSGFHQCIDTLFHHTRPTALLLNESKLFVAAQQHLARMGIIAPRDVSLICDDPDTAFSWCDPPVSHIRWDTRPVVSRIIRWANRVARGVPDKRQRYTLAEFVEGGTIGPVAD